MAWQTPLLLQRLCPPQPHLGAQGGLKSIGLSARDDERLGHVFMLDHMSDGRFEMGGVPNALQHFILTAPRLVSAQRPITVQPPGFVFPKDAERFAHLPTPWQAHSCTVYVLAQAHQLDPFFAWLQANETSQRLCEGSVEESFFPYAAYMQPLLDKLPHPPRASGVGVVGWFDLDNRIVFTVCPHMLRAFQGLLGLPQSIAA